MQNFTDFLKINSYSFNRHSFILDNKKSHAYRVAFLLVLFRQKQNSYYKAVNSNPILTSSFITLSPRSSKTDPDP